MRTIGRFRPAAIAGLLSLASVAAGQGIKGQWDFDQADLRATVGVAMQYRGATGGATQFNTTANFGIPAIGGQVANVMRYPACSASQGYIMHTNAPPNGGGSYINQYSLIMDLYVAAGGYRCLFQTNLSNANEGDFFINPSNALGVDGNYQGSFTSITWHRLAVVVDLTSLTMSKYVDGVLAGTQNLNDAIDGRWSLYCSNDPQDYLLLFTDDTGETGSGYVNSIQFRDYRMTAAEIAALGGPSAAGIPRTSPPTFAQWDFNGNLNATTASPALTSAASPPAASAGVTFSTTTIGGASAQVANFTRGTYLKMTHGLPAGGSLINQYSLIVDVMFPDTVTTGWAALWQTSSSNSDDGEWYIRGADHAIGISGTYGGQTPDGTWNRLALVVDATAGTYTSYINGAKVQQLTGIVANDRWAIGTVALLFADNDAENSAGSVNSVQIRSYPMSDAEIAALGGASAAGIPIPQAPGGITLTSPNGTENWQAGSAHPITWTSQNPTGLVSIDLYQGANYRGRLGDVSMTTGQFTWNISPSIGDATNYRVRVTASAFPDITDTSNGDFSIYGSVEPGPTITKLPMLQGPNQTDMTLMWETDIGTGTQAVEWGVNSVSENISTNIVNTTINSAHYFHEATFGPLQPETVYQYRVRSGTTYSDIYSFRSGPQLFTPTRVVWFGDEHNYGIFSTQVPHIAAEQPDMVFAAGDLMNDGSSLTEWHNYWFKPLEIAHLSQTHPIMLTRGNHDGEFALAYQYTSLPGNETYYAFTYGNVRYIVVDSNLTTNTRPDQYSWLANELQSPATQAAQFRIVVFHIPAFTNIWNSYGPDGEVWIRNDWVPLFEQYNVDMVVNGHVHSYLRGTNNDVTYLIVGGAGNVLDTVYKNNWNFFVKAASVYHYAVMNVDHNTLSWVSWNIDGSLLDAFKLTSTTPVPWPDFDGDSDVDATDLTQFEGCVTGPNLPRTPQCFAADFDGDGDVDQADFGVFQGCYSGANKPAAPHCNE